MSDSRSPVTLDDVMAEIQRTSSLPLEPVIPSSVVGEGSGAGLTPVPTTQANVVMDTLSLSASAQTVGNVAPTQAMNSTAQQLWGSNLSPRQRRLPKIPYQMLGGFVAMLIFALGLGSATYLTSQTQDLRNQAYEDVLPDVEGPLATETQEQYEARLRASQQSQSLSPDTVVETPFGSLTLLSGVLLGVGAFLLIAFFIWFFVV